MHYKGKISARKIKANRMNAWVSLIIIMRRRKSNGAKRKTPETSTAPSFVVILRRRFRTVFPSCR